MRIDNVTADRVLSPESPEELAAIFRDESGSIAPVGGGTQLEAGNPLRQVEIAVETARLNRVTEYVASDLTIHVQAGVRWTDLAETLAEQGQMLALDPWVPPGATIGGIVATNAQGALRAVGTLRDWIIGMQVVHADGRVSRTGGRVVKNVSGYDLAKLYTGSMGSLAVISEVSFKLRAAWESTATAELRLDDAHAGAAMIDAIRRGPTEPIALVWCGPENRIAVRFGEHPSAVAWQMDQLPAADWKRFDRESESVVWEAVRSHYEQMPGTVARVAVLPAAVAGVIERFRPSHWLVHGTIGTAMMTIDPEVVRGLRAEFPSVLERAPIDVRERIPWFGVGPTDYDLMRKMKDAFDPDHRLNPGRHVDGEPGGQPET